MVKLNSTDTASDWSQGRLAARLYEPRSTRSVDVWFEVDEQTQGVQIRYRGLGSVQAARISEFPDRIAGVADSLMLELAGDAPNTQRRLEFFESLPADFILPGQTARQGWLSRIESGPVRYGLLLLTLTVLAVVIYRFSLGYIVDGMVNLVPRSLEQQISQRALEWVEDDFDAPSGAYTREMKVMTKAVRDFADHENLGFVPQVRIRDASGYGPNAFAFPGGPIIVTEAMMELELSDAALQGLMAHEYVHIANRHSLRQIARVVGVITLSSMVFGGEGFSPDEIVVLVMPLVENGFSRKYETESDLRGQELLDLVGYESGGMTELMIALRRSCQPFCFDLGLLSTHPSWAQRMKDLNGGEIPETEEEALEDGSSETELEVSPAQ